MKKIIDKIMATKLAGSIRDNFKVIVITALSTLAAVAIIHYGEAHISSDSFCTSCHSMTYVEEELKQSVHYGRVGINPGCADCHLPPSFISRSMFHMISGPRDLLGEFKYDLSTKEKFNEHRASMAHTARMNLKKWDSAPCRQCHIAPKPTSQMGQMMHATMETSNTTCIDCHQNIAHAPVPVEKLKLD